MTIEQRLNKIELMLAEMQTKIGTLTAGLHDVSLQLDEALKRIEGMEQNQMFGNKHLLLTILKDRLN